MDAGTSAAAEAAANSGLPVTKPELPARWLALLLMSLLLLGSYYTYDNPAALHDQLADHFSGQMGKDQFEYSFNLMYTVYSLPNIVLPFFGGYFVDRLGARRMNVVFACCTLLGQFCVAAGASMRSVFIMLVGRTIFGFGGESLCVGASTLLAQWFAGKEMALALGLNLSLARLGSFVNDITSPALAQHTGSVNGPLWFSVFICVMSLAAAIGLMCLDRWADQRCNVEKTESEPIRLSDIRAFPRSFWLLTFSCVVVYGCVLPFNNIASTFLIQKYYCGNSTAPNVRPGECCPPGIAQCPAHQAAEAEAGVVMGIPFIMSGTLTPFLGGFIDWYGGRAVLTVLSSLILMVVHSILGFSHLSPAGALVFQGIAYAIYAAALWPSIPIVVKDEHTGTGYGLVTAIQNIGLALFPLIIASLRSHSGNYRGVESMMVMLAAMGAVAGVLLNLDDMKHRWGLNAPTADQKKDDPSKKRDGDADGEDEEAGLLAGGTEDSNTIN